MNWPGIILDVMSMTLLFNAVAGLGFLLWPQDYWPPVFRQDNPYK